MERRCKAALAAAEVCKVHLLQRRPKLGFGCIGPGHPEVGFHRTLEDGRIVGHQCQQAQAVGLLPFADRDAAQRDSPSVTVRAPDRMAAMVLLPQPLSPTSETKLPCGMIRDTSCRMVRSFS